MLNTRRVNRSQVGTAARASEGGGRGLRGAEGGGKIGCLIATSC